MIYLIRHGKTEANERHLYCGSSDLPLSPAGAVELKQLRYEIHPLRFITSGMKRTEQTLRLLFGEVPHRREPAFRELCFGTFELRSYEELKEDPEYLAWISGDNEANTPPRGESGIQLKARVLAAFSEVEDHTAILTHGGVIAVIMQSLFQEEGKSRYQWQPKPGHGYALDGTRYYPIP